jgi:hypothetical protein
MLHRRIIDLAGQGIKPDPISRITKTKRADFVDQLIERLPGKCKTLSKISTISKVIEKTL